MDYDVIFSLEASEDIEKSIFYISNVLLNPIAAKALVSEINEVLLFLKSNAHTLSYHQDESLKEMGYRKISFKKHNYIFVYKIVDNVVQIHGFFNTRENYKRYLVSE